MTKTKLAAGVLATLVAFAVLSGCGGHRYRTVACASEVTEHAQKSGGSTSSGGSRSSSSSSSSSSRSSTSSQHSTAARNQAKPPAAQNKSVTPSGGSSSKASGSDPGKAKATPPAAQNQSKVTPPGEKSYKPPPADVKPPAKKYDAAAKSAPAKVSRNGSYRSPVTHHTYVFHDALWYSSPGYRMDLFDPFNPWNYTNPLSPFYSRPYVVVDRC